MSEKWRIYPDGQEQPPLRREHCAGAETFAITAEMLQSIVAATTNAVRAGYSDAGVLAAARLVIDTAGSKSDQGNDDVY